MCIIIQGTLHLPAGWSRILNAVMRIVIYNEREYVVSDDNCLKCVPLKTKETKITSYINDFVLLNNYFLIITKHKGA